MDKILLAQFLTDNFFTTEVLFDNLLDFINLSKLDQKAKIQLWAQAKVQTLTNEKNNLDAAKQERSDSIDAQITKLGQL